MTIQIYGTGCTKCNMLEKEVRKAIENSGVDAQIEKIEDIEQIMEAGIMLTPALGIDGVVKSTGKVLSEKHIIELIEGEAQ